MKVRPRTFVIALALALLASAIGIAILLIPADGIPPFHYVTDLQTHVAALDHTDALGLQVQSYDTDPNLRLGIIDIDDASLKSSLGTFPWPRSVYGTLLKKLKAAGARAVVFDIDFVEPASDPKQDVLFSAGMRDVPSVLGYIISETSGGKLFAEPVPPTLRTATATGYTSVGTPGGYLLGMPMQILTEGPHGTPTELESLPFAAAQTMLGHTIDNRAIPTLNGEMLLIPPKLDTHEHNGEEVFIPRFAGRTMLSFIDAYQNESASALRQFADGSIIYIGSTAQAEFDFTTTTRGRVPGLFINARLADQLLRNQFITPAPLWLNIALIVILSCVLALTFSLVRTSIAIAVSLATTVLFAYGNLVLFVTKLVWVDLVHVVAAMLLTTMFVALYRVLHEGAQRRMVTNLFGMHVSPAIVTDILAQDDPGGALSLRGKRVKATIFYSDIRGFTAMSETMTPEEIYTQLNEYFEEMCTIIFKYGGYVDKFIGDCVMAVFSAPYPTPHDAEHATRAAVEQQKKILELSEKWKAMGKREFTVGMGINTGEVVMGNLGASSRMNYTVIGDNVNVAARLYNVALGGEIIISESTYDEVKDCVVAEERAPVAVKGKTQPIRIYNIVDVKPPVSDVKPA